MFENIVGQQKIIENLDRAFKNNKIAHAYLLEGAEGLGKRHIAKYLAKNLVCSHKAEKPCNSCNSCKKASSGNHPDIKIIEDGNIKIKEMRNIIGEMQLKPYESSSKICLIYHADKMSSQVQNTLLKTLEEPPSYVTIILLTSKASALLPTIISRCQVIRLYPVNLENIKHYLIKHKNVHEEKAHMLAAFSEGIVGQAIKLLEDADFHYRREEVIHICNKILTSNLFDILEQIKFFEEEKLHIAEIFDIMIKWYRDLLIYGETNNMALAINVDKREEIDFQAKRISSDKIRDIIFIIEKAKNNLISNVQFHLNIQVMLLNMQEVLAK